MSLYPVKAACLIIVFCATTASGSAAQQADTLDARGYFPLQVGNVWEYTHHLTRPRTIYRPTDESERRQERYFVADSLRRDDTLFYQIVYREHDQQGTLLRLDTLAVWYDEPTSTLRGGESLAMLRLLCGLNAPFGDNRYTDSCWPFVENSELLMPPLFGTTPVTAKKFGSHVWAFEAVHGVGVVTGRGGCEPCGSFSDYDG